MLDEIGSLLFDYDGEYRYADGKIYKGSLAGGIRDGQGTMIWPDGSRYTGDWLFGVVHGRGSKEYINKCVYAGGWILGHPSSGEYLCPSGEFFKGELDGIESFVTVNGTLVTTKKKQVIKNQVFIKGRFAQLKKMLNSGQVNFSCYFLVLASSVFILFS